MASHAAVRTGKSSLGEAARRQNVNQPTGRNNFAAAIHKTALYLIFIQL
jgi:hypothetical protein